MARGCMTRPHVAGTVPIKQNGTAGRVQGVTADGIKEAILSYCVERQFYRSCALTL
jgi:hypothetical protein